MLNQDLPERSQSSIGFPQAKDWVYSVANKLEEQHGLRRARKSSQRTEMQENLLMVRYDSVRTRRSRSAEGRYFLRPQESDKVTDSEGACGGCDDIPSLSTSRRNSSTSTIMVQPTPSQLKSDLLNSRIKSRISRRGSVNVADSIKPQSTSLQTGSRLDSPSNNNIKIQINDDDSSTMDLQ